MLRATTDFVWLWDSAYFPWAYILSTCEQNTSVLWKHVGAEYTWNMHELPCLYKMSAMHTGWFVCSTWFPYMEFKPQKQTVEKDQYNALVPPTNRFLVQISVLGQDGTKTVG